MAVKIVRSPFVSANQAMPSTSVNWLVLVRPVGVATPHLRTMGGSPQAITPADGGSIARRGSCSIRSGRAARRALHRPVLSAGGGSTAMLRPQPARLMAVRASSRPALAYPLVRSSPAIDQRFTTGQVRVREIPGTDWMRAATSRPSSFIVDADARTMTS